MNNPVVDQSLETAPYSRQSYDAELANLENALASGNYAYGGYDNALQDIYTRVGQPSGVSYQEAQGTIGNLYNKYYAPQTNQEGTDTYAPAAPTGGSGTSSTYSPADISYLQSIKQQYLDQQGQLGTTLEQGNRTINDQYNKGVSDTNFDKTKQSQAQTATKGENYSKINNAANRGYNSLASILGRASGTGSSVFQQLLPNVIGKDISSKRTEANTVYGKNMSNIDSSFASVLQDLADQKRKNEEDLYTGIGDQRTKLASQIGGVEGQLAYSGGGDLAAVRAAQAPYEAQARQSQLDVNGLFDKYFKPFTPKAAAPELSNYTMDRSQINAGNQGTADASNPYAALLRRKLQGQA